MSTRIYVGNLPFSATDNQLSQLFSQYGEVTEAAVIVDRDSGQSKGFGFVQMSDDAAARTAIAELNGAMLDNRSIRVNEAQARPDRSSRGGGGGRRGKDYRDRRW